MGVSGGPDSTALLLILTHLREELGIELAVAHFDHGLRSRQEAEEDAAYVRGLAEGQGLQVNGGRGDVRGHARANRQSIEEAARHLRYAFLAREARRLKARVVAVGHTRDDQAETVLLHILRGSGLDGLVAMRAHSSWPLGAGPEVVRPLLDVCREETERYCREVGVAPREDPTNLQLEATRNRVRHELLPLLRRFNPSITDALVRLAAATVADSDYLGAMAEEAWQALAQAEGETVLFPRSGFQALAPALATRLLRRGVRHLAGLEADLEAAHLEALLAALGKRRSRLSLPGGVVALIDAGHLKLVLGEPRAAAVIPEKPLVVPGRTAVRGWWLEAEIVPPPAKPSPGPDEAYLDADAVGALISVRSRRAGDRLRPLGLGGEKKVQDLLVDAKVRREERDGVPLVCAEWGIVWVVGHCIDQRSALTPASRRALRLRFRRRPEG